MPKGYFFPPFSHDFAKELKVRKAGHMTYYSWNNYSKDSSKGLPDDSFKFTRTSPILLSLYSITKPVYKMNLRRHFTKVGGT